MSRGQVKNMEGSRRCYFAVQVWLLAAAQPARENGSRIAA